MMQSLQWWPKLKHRLIMQLLTWIESSQLWHNFTTEINTAIIQTAADNLSKSSCPAYRKTWKLTVTLHQLSSQTNQTDLSITQYTFLTRKLASPMMIVTGSVCEDPSTTGLRSIAVANEASAKLWDSNEASNASPTGNDTWFDITGAAFVAIATFMPDDDDDVSKCCSASAQVSA